jgi:hypothetical protein
MGLREDIQSDLAESFDDPDGLADAVRQPIPYIDDAHHQRRFLV